MEHLRPHPESVSGIVTVTAGVKNTAQGGGVWGGGGSLEDIFDAFILFHPLKSSLALQL